MSAQTVDPFDLDELPDRPPRDQYERPLLVPAGGGPRQWYSRMSSLSNNITDSTGLHIWEKRLLARGLAMREDLTAMLAALPALFEDKADKNSLTREQQQHDRDVKKKIDEHCEQALDTAGRNFKANHGTAIHGFTEPDADRNAAPARMAEDIASWDTRLIAHGIRVVATEVFVANDTLRAAGSFDHIAWVPGLGFCVVDKKTGQVDGKGLEFAVQLAGYAHSDVYDLDTDQRAPLESLTGGEMVNREWGVIAHIPLGGRRTDFYKVPLDLGYIDARRAAAVRDSRSRATKKTKRGSRATDYLIPMEF
jgi:hypothetical protein